MLPSTQVEMGKNGEGPGKGWNPSRKPAGLSSELHGMIMRVHRPGLVKIKTKEQFRLLEVVGLSIQVIFALSIATWWKGMKILVISHVIFWIPCEISKTHSFKVFQQKPSAVLTFQEQKTWQWKIDCKWRILIGQSPINEGFSASHVWWHRRVNLVHSCPLLSLITAGDGDWLQNFLRLWKDQWLVAGFVYIFLLSINQPGMMMIFHQTTSFGCLKMGWSSHWLRPFFSGSTARWRAFLFHVSDHHRPQGVLMV